MSLIRGASRLLKGDNVLVLLQLNGPKRGKVFRFREPGPEAIGRQTARVKLVDTRVSRRHAEISYQNGIWLISDCGSSNGTFVNGRRIQRLAELEAGDRIQMGRLTLRVVQATPLSLRQSPPKPAETTTASPAAATFDEAQEAPVDTRPTPKPQPVFDAEDAEQSDVDQEADDWSQLAQEPAAAGSGLPPAGDMMDLIDQELAPFDAQKAAAHLSDAADSGIAPAEPVGELDEQEDDGPLPLELPLAQLKQAPVDDADDEEEPQVSRRQEQEEQQKHEDADLIELDAAEPDDHAAKADQAKEAAGPKQTHGQDAGGTLAGQPGDSMLDAVYQEIRPTPPAAQEMDFDALAAPPSPALSQEQAQAEQLQQSEREDQASEDKPKRDDAVEQVAATTTEQVEEADADVTSGDAVAVADQADGPEAPDAPDAPEVPETPEIAEAAEAPVALVTAEAEEESAEAAEPREAAHVPRKRRRWPLAVAAMFALVIAAGAVLMVMQPQWRDTLMQVAGLAPQVQTPDPTLAQVPPVEPAPPVETTPQQPRPGADDQADARDAVMEEPDVVEVMPTPDLPVPPDADGRDEGITELPTVEDVVPLPAADPMVAQLQDVPTMYPPTSAFADAPGIVGETTLSNRLRRPEDVPEPDATPMPAEPSPAEQQPQESAAEPEQPLDEATRQTLIDPVLPRPWSGFTEANEAAAILRALEDPGAERVVPRMPVAPDASGREASRDDALPPAAIDEPRRVVYVVDASGSMVDSLAGIIDWLRHPLRGLGEQDQFTIIFFRADEAIEVPPAGLKPATRATVRQVRNWMQPDKENITTVGRSDPIRALQLAMEYDPTDLYLLSDNSLGRRYDQQALAPMFDQLDTLFAQRTLRLRLVQFYYEDDQQLMKKIAERYNGRFAFVRMEQSAGVDPFQWLHEAIDP